MVESNENVLTITKQAETEEAGIFSSLQKGGYLSYTTHEKQNFEFPAEN